jgi:cytochrome P450
MQMHRDVAPGPKGWPLIGSLPNMIGDRMTFIRGNFNRYGEIFRVRVPQREVYVLSNPDFIKHVLVDNAANYVKGNIFIKLHPFLGQGLFTSEGELWRKQRRLMQPHFHKESVGALTELMVSTIADSIERWRSAARSRALVEFAPEMMRLTLDVVTRALFGTDVDADAQTVGRALTVVLEHTNHRLLALVDFTDLFPFLPANRRYHDALATLDRIVYGIIDARRKSSERRADLLQMLLDARDPESGESMSRQQLRDEVMTLFLAGHETTANALAWTWYLLDRHPAIDRRLRDEVARALGERRPTAADVPKLAFARQVFEEAMRMFPPVIGVPRDAVADDRIGGYRIPAGATVTSSAFLTHHNPRLWPDPDRFDPDRFAPGAEPRHPFAYLPFGAGQRKCIGHAFATIEGTLAVAMIAQAFRPKLERGVSVVPMPQVTLRPSRIAVRLLPANDA